MAMDTGRGGGVRGLRPLFALLEPYTEEWMDEQDPSEPPEIGAALLLVERFDGLIGRLHWLEERARRDFDLDPSGFAAAVALSGMLEAARRSGVPVDTAPPEPVTGGLLSLWTPLLARDEHVTPPQVAAAFFAGGWSPSRRWRWDGPRWEPASLVLRAVTYKAVWSGLHSLASRAVPPLLRERCEDRASFDGRVLSATHAIAVSLARPPHEPTGRERSIASWSCQDSSLWGLSFDAILGPGRPGGDGRGERPLAGAFTTSLLGQWCQQTMGIAVKTVEEYFCVACEEPHPDAQCPEAPAAVVMATSRRNRCVTPKARLDGDDRSWGHEQARRKICKNPACLEKLRQLLRACRRGPCLDQQPLYDAGLSACPYCGAGSTRWHKTVWTRHP